MPMRRPSWPSSASMGVAAETLPNLPVSQRSLWYDQEMETHMREELKLRGVDLMGRPVSAAFMVVNGHIHAVAHGAQCRP